MKKKWMKITGIVLGSIGGLVLIGCLIYVYLYYPRPAEPFEFKGDHPVRRILIATQGSDFKNVLVENLCDSLKNSPVYIKGVRVKDLDGIDHGNWDRILIVNSFLVWLNRHVQRFVRSAAEPEKILLMVTSGGGDWQPEPDLKVDAFTSASRKVNVRGLVRLISHWLQRDDAAAWEPADHLLALKFFSRADVETACRKITVEQDRYKSMYPDLVNLINSIGYQFLRLKDPASAVEVFRLNLKLFPEHWNVYDSYGEILLRTGDRTGAIENYSRALELNPRSQSSRRMLKKLRR